MKRIIEEVLAAEEKVGTILKQAREKASEIKRSAENEISERMNEAKQSAREIVQTAVEEARREAEGIRAEKLEMADTEKDILLSGRNPDDSDRKDVIDDLVNEICNVITTTGREKDTE